MLFFSSDLTQDKKHVIDHSLVRLVAATRWKILLLLLLLLLLREINLGLDVWIVLLLGWLLIHLLLSTHHWLLLAHHRLLHHRLLHPRLLLLSHHHLGLSHNWLLTHHRLVHHGLLHHRLHHHWLLLAHHIWLLTIDSLPGQHLNALAQSCDTARCCHTCVRTCWCPDALKTDTTRLLALVVDREPVIDTSIGAKS